MDQPNSNRSKSLFRRWLRHPVTGVFLVIVLFSATLMLAALEFLSLEDFVVRDAAAPSVVIGDSKSDGSTAQILSTVANEVIAPTDERHLQAPPKSQLGGAEVNPFLLGVIGKENLTQSPAPTATRIFDRELVLGDGENRINKQFEIIPTLKDRVGFWFDVYSKYDQNHRIIHDQRFPWIVYKVVDVSGIINASSPRVRWLRNVKADLFVKLETVRIRKVIQKLAKGVPPEKLSSDELPVFEALRRLGKDVRKIARAAVGDIRVQTGQRNFFMDGLAVSPRYLSAMEKIFREKKLPIELTRLPFVESSFNQEAISKVGAGGIWQFMGDTGRKFLIVDQSIDERRSPFKASEAAAMLLKENHMILGHSWPLAITAWNHGPGGVRKACAAARSKDLGLVIARYHSKSFDFASANFYSEFLGALYAERYKDLIFENAQPDTELEPMIVRVQKSVRTNDVIRSSGLSKKEFLLMNPDLVQAQVTNVRLPIGFRIHLPERARTGVEQLVGSRGHRIARAN